jgi:ComF family protein
MSYFTALRTIQECLFPNYCVHCKKRSDQAYDLCQRCESKLPKPQPYCRRCGTGLAPYPEPGLERSQTSCVCCSAPSPPWRQITYLFAYEEPIQSYIRQLKFTHAVYFARLFGLMIAELLQTQTNARPFDVIVPIPLHVTRLHERGYNQAHEIARFIAKSFACPIDPWCCRRTLPTAAQAQLNSFDRRHNVSDAFYCPQPIKTPRILLVDDVMATGSTLRAASKALLAAGAHEVQVVCVAKTIQS